MVVLMSSAQPGRLLDAIFASLIMASLAFRASSRALEGRGSGRGEPQEVRADPRAASLRYRFLAAFWAFKMADWLKGPYFTEVYASKVIHGQPASESLVARLFLTGFGASAALGAVVGRLAAALGFRSGALAGALFGSLAALSTKASTLPLLFAGRVAAGLSMSLLSTAPESWLSHEQVRSGISARWLSETLSLAYLGDSVVAVLAGQLSGAVAARGGPVAPFDLSQLFLAGGGAVVAATWRNDRARAGIGPASREGESCIGKGDAGISDEEECAASATPTATISAAWQRMSADPGLLAVGTVQALFEGAMYIFVTQWPPAMKAALPGRDVPFGKVFSCFMASAMLGSSMFGGLVRSLPVEPILAGALAVAAGAMTTVLTAGQSSFAALLGKFLVFEACVGVYFPAIGMMRSKHFPDSHRGVMMSITTVPLNLIVVATMLGAKRLGLRGSLACCAAALQGAFLAQAQLCCGRGPCELAQK